MTGAAARHTAGTGLGALAVLLASVLWGTTGTAATLSLLEPAVAAVFAVLVVGEHLPALGWTGIALVIACLGAPTALSRPARVRTAARRSPAPRRTPARRGPS